MAQRQRFDYVVEFPDISMDGVRIGDLELISSTSERGAASIALFKKFNGARNGIIGRTMTRLDNHFGGAQSYAVEIPEDIGDGKGGTLQKDSEDYQIAQEVFLATQLGEDRGDHETPERYLPEARRLLRFYRDEMGIQNQ